MTKGEFVITFCENAQCKKCPCYLEGFDSRTKEEKELLHELCYVNLMEWIKRKWEEE